MTYLTTILASVPWSTRDQARPPLRQGLPLLLLLACACGGGSDLPPAPANPDPQTAREGALKVFPDSMDMGVGEFRAFRAFVTGPADLKTIWEIREGNSGGRVTQGGVYSAPVTPGEYHLDVRSAAWSELTTSVTVRVRPPLAWPRAVNPMPGESVRIEPLMRLASGELTPVPDPVFRVVEGGAGGSITAGGLYTAPSEPGSYQIEVSSSSHRIFATVVTASVVSHPVWVARAKSPTDVHGMVALPDGSLISYGGGVISRWDWEGQVIFSTSFSQRGYSDHLVTADSILLSTGFSIDAFDHGGDFSWTIYLGRLLTSLVETDAGTFLFVGGSVWPLVGEIGADGQPVWIRKVNGYYETGIKNDGNIILAGSGPGYEHVTFAVLNEDTSPRATFMYHFPGAGSVRPQWVKRKFLAPTEYWGLVSFTTAGEVEWGVQFLIGGRVARGWIDGMDWMPDGDLVVAGILHEELGEQQHSRHWIARLAPDGKIRWAREFRGLGDSERLVSLDIAPTGLIDFTYHKQAFIPWDQDWVNLFGRLPPDGWLGFPLGSEFDLVTLPMSTRPLEWIRKDTNLIYVTDPGLNPQPFTTPPPVTSATLDYVRIAP